MSGIRFWHAGKRASHWCGLCVFKKIIWMDSKRKAKASECLWYLACFLSQSHFRIVNSYLSFLYHILTDSESCDNLLSLGPSNACSHLLEARYLCEVLWCVCNYSSGEGKSINSRDHTPSNCVLPIKIQRSVLSSEAKGFVHKQLPQLNAGVSTKSRLLYQTSSLNKLGTKNRETKMVLLPQSPLFKLRRKL